MAWDPTYAIASDNEQRASGVVDAAEQQLVLLQGLRAYRTNGAVSAGPAVALPLLHDRIETIARGVLPAVLLAAGILVLLELLRTGATTGPEPAAGTATEGARRPATKVPAGPPETHDNGLEAAWLNQQH